MSVAFEWRLGVLAASSDDDGAALAVGFLDLAFVDPFEAIQLPAAALALKQGFGRLIRRRDDRGIVAILDSRIVTRTYGRTFVDTLPSALPRTSALEQVRRWWNVAA